MPDYTSMTTDQLSSELSKYSVDASPQKKDYSNMSNEDLSNELGKYSPQKQSSSFPFQSQDQNQKSPINFGDMLKMAALNSPDEQQTYLKSKFKFAEPNQDGSFNVGNDPTNLSPIHPGTIGDAALTVLAKGAAMIPAMASQMGGATLGSEIGTAVGPGPGTIIGGLLGAGIGAGLGEGTKNALNSSTPGYDPQKAATDNVISGLFGAGGQALGDAVGFGVKNYIAPKLAAAMDGAIARSDNPSGAVNFMTKVMKFTANVDPKEMAKGYQLGFKNIYANPANLNPDEIDNIAQNMSQAYAQKKGIAATALDKAETSLLQDNPNATVKTSDILENITDQLQGMKILDKVSGVDAGQDGVSSTFKFRTDIPSDVKLNDVKSFLTRLGAQQSDGGAFHIPENSTVGLDDAVAAKKLFQSSFNNPNLNPSVANIVKTALYGEGASALYPKGFSGLRSAINDTAKASNHDSYIIANKNFSDLMNAKQGVMADNMGNKSTIPGWMDIENPSSVARYIKNINKLDAFNTKAVDNLQSNLGIDFKTPASQWAVAQAIHKASPQILRLGVVGGLLGLALPGSPLDRAGRVPMAFSLGSPTGVKIMARLSEGMGAAASKATGSQMINWLAQGATHPATRAIVSQSLKKKISG